MSAAFASAGLLGKAPCQADFIRMNAPAPVVHQFHRWLEDGLATLTAALRQFPPAPVSFAFTAPGERSLLVGAMAASTDKVGRQFPLSVFCEVESAPLADKFSLIPAAFADFLQAAAQLAGDAASIATKDELAARLSALPVPNAEALGAAEAQRQQALAERKGGALLAAIGKETPGAGFYAFRTFLTACVRERGKEPARANVILDCPLSQEMDPLPWLELACRLLQWRNAPPAFFWSAGTRLLLSLGPPTPSVIGFLANPAQTGTKLWPLRVSQPTAIASAREALSPAQREAIEREDTPLGELLRHLGS